MLLLFFGPHGAGAALGPPTGAFQPDAFQNDAFQIEGGTYLIAGDEPLSIWIDGVNRTTSVREQTGLDISYTLGGRGVCRYETIDTANDSTVTAYYPDIDEVVLVNSGLTRLFTGRIVSARLKAFGEPSIGISTAVDMTDLSTVLDNRIVTETYLSSLSWTLKGIVTDLVAKYAVVYGITLDAGMATGPTLATDVVFSGVTLRAALNYLSTITGWVNRLTPLNVLEMFPVGGKVASFGLSTSGAEILGDVVWDKERTTYINKVIVRFGGEKVVTKRIDMLGDSLTTTFLLDYTPVYQFSGEVVSSGVVVENLNLYYPLNGNIAGVIWTYDSGSNSLVRSPALPSGVPAYWDFAVQFPESATAEDAAEIASRGPYEARIEAPDITDRDTAEALAQGLLNQSKVIARKLTVRTVAHAIAWPGDSITLDIPERNVTGNWLILETRVRDFFNDMLEYEYVCLEGGVAQQTWLDYLRSAFGGGGTGSTTGGTMTGTFAPALTGFIAGDVTANTGLENGVSGPAEVSLRGTTFPGGLFAGPAIVLGRQDNAHAWGIVADHLAAGPVKRKLLFTPWTQKGAAQPAAMILQEDPVTDGIYYLTPYTLRNLHIGAPNSVYGPGYKVASVTSTGNIDSASDVIAATGLYERSRAYRVGEPQPYTPVWASTGGTAVTVGDAILGGRYTTVGKKVDFEIRFTFGSTSNAGAGNVFTFSLPSTEDGSGFGSFTARITDSGSQFYTAVGYLASTSTVSVIVTGTTNAGIGAGAPMVWAVNDSVVINGWYFEA